MSQGSAPTQKVMLMTLYGMFRWNLDREVAELVATDPDYAPNDFPSYDALVSHKFD